MACSAFSQYVDDAQYLCQYALEIVLFNKNSSQSQTCRTIFSHRGLPAVTSQETPLNFNLFEWIRKLLGNSEYNTIGLQNNTLNDIVDENRHSPGTNLTDMDIDKKCKASIRGSTVHQNYGEDPATVCRGEFGVVNVARHSPQPSKSLISSPALSQNIIRRWQCQQCLQNTARFSPHESVETGTMFAHDGPRVFPSLLRVYPPKWWQHSTLASPQGIDSVSGSSFSKRHMMVLAWERSTQGAMPTASME